MRPTKGRAISIHALREEGDLRNICFRCTDARNFYPRPPRGGRPGISRALDIVKKISIHALREEGDWSYAGSLVPGQIISIHALREEGDL